MVRHVRAHLFIEGSHAAPFFFLFLVLLYHSLFGSPIRDVHSLFHV
jgi:hypothetical protein